MFRKEFSDVNFIKSMKRTPNFNNILTVLKGRIPDRSTLFEFFLHDALYEKLADPSALEKNDDIRKYRINISAYKNAGYDYAITGLSDFMFENGGIHLKESQSLNEGGLITDWESFEKYKWNDPEDYESVFPKIEKELPEGMKFIVKGPGGVLENILFITGFDNLCYMLADDLDLAKEIFNRIGEKLIKYYTLALEFDCVGAAIVNDDWGFNTQTMLSPSDMRKYVIPWNKKIVKLIHDSGRPAIMHSCGMLGEVMDDIIDDIGFDAKHSYEDNIQPVEIAYEKLQGRIAVLGGIDLDFVCRKTPEEIYNRSKSMLERASQRGGYALGSGNSIPSYVPHENYFAMIAAALFNS